MVGWRGSSPDGSHEVEVGMPSGVVGVLLPVLGLFAIGGGVWVLVKYLELKRRASGGEDTGGTPVPLGKEERPRVVGRKWLLDHGSEARFYGVLEEAVAREFGAGKCRVMVQVPLCCLVDVEAGLERGEAQKWRNRIDRKRVDYVVCAAGTLKPMFAVELDGSSHDGAKRKERDGFVERVLGAAWVRLVRFDRRGREWVVGEVGEMMRTSRRILGATQGDAGALPPCTVTHIAPNGPAE